MTFLVSHLASSVAATPASVAKATKDAKAAKDAERSRRRRDADGYDAALDAVMKAQAPRETSGNTDEQTREDRMEHPGYDRPMHRGQSQGKRLDLEA